MRGHAGVHVLPFGQGGHGQARRVRDGGQMEQEVRRSADGGIHRHRVAQRALRHHVAHGQAEGHLPVHRARRAPRPVAPDGLAGRGERGVGKREAQRLRDHLRGGGGAEELAAAPGRGAGAAADVARFRERDEPVREAGADRLRLARVLAVAGGQGHAAGNDHRGQVAAGGEGHGHRRQPLVAGGHAHHRLARGQRAHEAPQDDGGVVAVGQAVEHAGRALRASVAGIGAERGERNAAEPADLLRGGLDEEADLPVPGVIAERERRAVRIADAAEGAEHEHLGAPQVGGRPAHSDVLRPAEDVAAGTVDEIRRREGQASRRSGLGGGDAVERLVLRVEDGVEGRAVRLHGSPTRRRRDCAARRSRGRKSSRRHLPRAPRPWAG